MSQQPSPTERYYDDAWKTKLARPEYATLDRRWRSRWDFVVENIGPGLKVLDIGCGDGILGERLIRFRNCDVHGVDVSEFALKMASQRGVVTNLCDASASILPFSDETFDAVVLCCVLEHVPHPEHILMEAYRVLKPTGGIFVTLPNPVTWKIRLSFLRGSFHPDFLHSKPGEGLHYRFWTYENGLESTISDLGCSLRIANKSIDVKNPRLYSKLSLRIRRFLIHVLPGLFGEYMHYILKKSTAITD